MQRGSNPKPEPTYVLLANQMNKLQLKPKKPPLNLKEYQGSGSDSSEDIKKNAPANIDETSPSNSSDDVTRNVDTSKYTDVPTPIDQKGDTPPIEKKLTI
jgi:hypothetical protein